MTDKDSTKVFREYLLVEQITLDAARLLELSGEADSAEDLRSAIQTSRDRLEAAIIPAGVA